MRLKGLIVVLMALGMGAPPDALALDQPWTWAVPTDGGPVIGYEFQINNDGGGWVSFFTDTNTILVDMPNGSTVCRVRAWNIDPDGDRQYGPWSDNSDEYVQVPPPGGCGSPFRNGS